MHPRQQIREAVASQLGGATGAGDRVFPTREAPWRRVELPAIAVYSLEESSEQIGEEGGLARTLTIAIYGVVTVTDRLDDEIDSLSAEIEDAMRSDPTFGGVAAGSTLTETKIGIDEQQGRAVGAVHLTYDVRYATE